MPTPSEHKTVQARILAYAEAIGWTVVSREAADKRRGGILAPRHSGQYGGHGGQESPPSLFFDELVEAKVREFNPRYAEAEGALLWQFRLIHTDIYGNRDFLEHLRNRGKFLDHEEKRERDLILIDYDDPTRNVYEVTEEWAFHNGFHGTREDVVFLINGIPVLMIECKNATKGEAIALGIDQIRRYHSETPEVMTPEMLFIATEAIGFAYGVTWNTVRRNIFNWKGEPNPNTGKGERVFQPVEPNPNGGKGERVFQPVEPNPNAGKGERVFQPVEPNPNTGNGEQVFQPVEPNPNGDSNTGRNAHAPFYSPDVETDKHRRNLPHWQQGEAWISVTWRLGDSLPKAKLDQWKAERAAWLSHHPEPWDENTEAEYHKRFSEQIDEWLDQGSGSCVLKDPANSKIVADALRHFDGERVELASFVVMPNHVHVLFRPIGGHELENVLKSWKGFTAREINKRLGKTGALWQDEYWDRLIRSEQHFFKSAEYIQENPSKAQLHEGQFVLWESGFSNPPKCPPSVPGRLEDKVKSFCDPAHVLRLLKDFILFAEKEEELQKFILRQHQATAVDRVVERALDPTRTRGLVWHTQGSGKTYTMIKAAELMFKANEAQKPTILLMIDRNELEDQMLKNLASVGLANVAHADRITTLNSLLDERGQDYRGIIVTMIHKFRDMPADLNTRKNIFVLIDEAHRTTGGDLGNFLMAGLPNATFIGFTGTPVDLTAYGKGTFKTFGCEDDKGYLHKYSIAESIEDGTTLPLYYNLAPNEMLVPLEIMEKEFLALAETEGISDIEELNKILERAVNLKNFLKGKDRVNKVARYVADHFLQNVEPLGYKAFLVAVDREACAFYKEALDAILPPEYSEIVFTGNNNDEPHLKKWHLDPKKEKQIRKSFTKPGEWPKILIVTEKLLTGFDAPILYAMYLDKPMRDHTLLQAIARVNRPYENEAAEMVKPHGFVLDFVGIFDKLEKALAFDSDEVNAIVKDLALLKHLFKAKMETKAPPYLALVTGNFNDKDVDNLIEQFRDKERRKEFFREYKEIEMLYEIISPDAFLRPFIDNYTTLSSIYAVVQNAYAKRVYVDRAFQKKTNELVQKHIGADQLERVTEFVKIDADTIELIKEQQGGYGTKIINLVKSIEKAAEEESGDPFLIALSDRAMAVQENFEERQSSTEEALAQLFTEIERNEQRKKDQAAKGLDDLTYFVLCKLTEDGIPSANLASKKVGEAFTQFSNWRRSEAELRELRNKVTFAIFEVEDDMAKVSATVEALFVLLERSYRQ